MENVEEVLTIMAKYKINCKDEIFHELSRASFQFNKGRHEPNTVLDSQLAVMADRVCRRLKNPKVKCLRDESPVGKRLRD